VGTDVVDYPGCHTRGGFVDRLFGQLNPPNPITASLGYDLHIFAFIARLAVKRTAIFSEPGPLRICGLIAANCLCFLIDCIDLKRKQKLADLFFVSCAVFGLLKQRADFLVRLQHWLGSVPVRQVKDFRP
jgi:hypothetical protein